jgi:hypothetical protein
MSITERTYNALQLFHDQQRTSVTDNIAGIYFGHDDANVSLQDWSGHENFFVSFDNPTGSEEHNRGVEIDPAWAKIAKWSREKWSKENPY